MKSSPNLSLGDIIEKLPGLSAEHSRTSVMYRNLERAAKAALVDSSFDDTEGRPSSLGSFKDLAFPYTKMGAIDSLDLFGLDELIIFSFYWINRARYHHAADIGANLGLHSVLMDKCGWKVKAYEPDPNHALLLRRNLELNRAASVDLIEAAVSDKAGTLEFVRELGNTTSSHLAGAKQNAYGPLDHFPVKVVSIKSIMPEVDFIKIDAEGQESVIILGTTASHWRNTDMMIEVNSKKNARDIFDHLQKIEVNAFAQKLGWQNVTSFTEMPTSYKDGSLFLTQRDEMNWS